MDYRPTPFTFKDGHTEQGPTPAPGDPADRAWVTVLKGARGAGDLPPAPQRTDAHAVATHPARRHARQTNQVALLQDYGVQVFRPRRRLYCSPAVPTAALGVEDCRVDHPQGHQERAAAVSEWLRTYRP